MSQSYEDAKHRPHAIHTGEVPRNPITYGPESISVRLDRFGPIDALFTSMYDALQANWGESPSRTVLRNDTNCPGNAPDGRVPNPEINRITGWKYLQDHERDYVESCFAGKTLQQVLEGVTFDFCIDGVTRAFTHQNVRTRLGAGFMQHGGRDNDWRHRRWTMPETIMRMCEAREHPMETSDGPVPLKVVSRSGLEHCIVDWKPIEEYLDFTPHFDGFSQGIRGHIEHHIKACRDLYAALVDAGIPWQDARRVLPIGMQTYIHDQYNYLAVQGMLGNRLEFIMDWEHVCVAQLMLREIKMRCPPLVAKYLGSHSDRAKQARFAGLESWPADGKWPSPFERCECGHAKANHYKVRTSAEDATERDMCEACEREAPRRNEPLHDYKPVDSLPRQHRPEQNPFWVLHPDSMAGGPVVWIPTNGKYPHDEVRRVIEG